MHNDKFNGFADILPQIVESETEAAFDIAPALFDLLPHDLTHYFTYNGSLTTPPCSEVVTWIDFKEHIHLSHDQVMFGANISKLNLLVILEMLSSLKISGLCEMKKVIACQTILEQCNLSVIVLCFIMSIVTRSL